MISRVLRIYPGFIAAFSISVLVVGYLGRRDSSYFLDLDWRSFFVYQIFLRDPSFLKSFVGQPFPNVNGSLWTIVYEFACYLLVVSVGYLGKRYWAWIWFGLTVSLVVATLLVRDPRWSDAVDRMELGEGIKFAAIFCCGGSWYLLGLRKGHARRGLLLGFPFLLSMFSWSFGVFGFALFGSAFLLCVGLATRRMKRIGGWPDISYGTYLYGWPVQKLLRWYFPDMGPLLLFGTSLILALCCGYLSWTFIEARFLRSRRRSAGGEATS